MHELSCVADAVGQSLLTLTSSLLTCAATVGSLPNGLGTLPSCPAHTNTFLTRVYQKSLHEIFLTPNEEIRTKLFMMAISNRWKNYFLVHFHVWWLIELLFATDHVMVTIYHNLWLYGFPSWIFTFCCSRSNICQHVYVQFVPPQYCREVPLVLRWISPPFSFIFLGSRSCGTPSCWSNHSTVVNLFHSQVIK